MQASKSYLFKHSQNKWCMCKQFWWIHHYCTMHEKCFYFLLHSSLSGKMLFLGKLKFIYPSCPKHYNNCSASPPLLILFKNFLAPPPFKKESRDYTFYMRKYKVVTIKLLPFYMTNFLFTELQSHNIWRKLKNHMKNDIPNNIFPSHVQISGPNLL